MDDTSSEAGRPNGRLRFRSWLSEHRWAFVLAWTFVAVASALPFALIPGFNDPLVDFHASIASDDWRLGYFAFSALITAPLIETALIALPVIWLRHHRVNDTLLVLVGAAIVAVLHQAFATNALLVFPPFLVFAFVYVSRTRPPHNDGFVLSVLVHVFYNVLPLIALVLYRYFPDR